MTLLDVQGISKNFGGLKAVNNLSLKVERGEIHGLIGPNGAGKTTAFNLITGFYSVDSGKILFKGEDITGNKPEEICKKGISRTFQLTKPFRDVTVLANVAVGAFCRVKKESEALKEAMDVLEFVGLTSKRYYLGENLTIADRKRLELARALATKPELVLLDEPIGGLNPVETEEMIALIKRLQQSGVTLLIVEHVMQVIMGVCNKITVVNYGSKIAEGTPKEIASDEKVIKAYLGEEYVFASGQ